ncbi:contact-dependent growth inhibition system immunity protein [Bacillus swezeyi]|uniref:CdiI immunity protein domain-containing protein n=1 Tax=Bacillus swezeyi TaxID=1925020 RepID=A0A1R1RM83_9BACI|nr:contact-dependent growth inhibition system immunity protein [Bacillus swezeyi]MEC1262991.1 contact-dependent growth inhibition system immunity protein [Bacillus swezeyi]MED2929978.1 contact-dependent growth inhibition system immunity protein [Bacillus swezeyi]MED2963131.1 contact-dependent growth inhibition system immunity protein [Bacillus swezeyi]MED3074339.1 contact-dependent growth inhibition system immunity protein [Bacillus swezeyi]MED3084494.1 contact-dependent growth inhibition syst
MIEIKISDPVYQFLSGIFHQEIESPESALEEYLDEVSKKEQEDDVIALTDFMNSQYSEEDKNDFIVEATDGVDFSYEVSPLIWLKQVTQKIENNIKAL